MLVTRSAVLRNRGLLTLMLGHFTVDMYVGLLPVLYPLLIQRFALDLRTVGLVSLAYSGMASISQPLFGWVADRYGTRFTGAALVWTATMFSTIGFAPSFPVLLGLAAAAGLGSGMFHPFGALSARAVIARERHNTAMSVYVTAGTIGVALGPLIGAAIFTLLGVHGTILMCLPGLCSAIWLLHALGPTARQSRPRQARARGAPARPIPWVPLLAVIVVMMSRNWTVISLEAFIPSWYRSLGYAASFYGPLASTVVLASACGTVGSGTLADRYGRRAVILCTLALSIPCLLLFAQYTGGIAFLTGALVGLLAASTGPLMLVMAQELMTGRVGVASGLVMGIGFIAGAVGVPITGALGDAFGMATAVRLQAILVLLTMLLIPLLPSEAKLRALHRERYADEGGMPEPGGETA